MLCELCHKNDAGGVLHRKDANGEDEELYVCKSCLAQHCQGSADGDGSTEPDAAQRERPEIVAPDGDEPPAFIRNFLDAAVGLIEGVAKSEPPKERKCPVCGRTWNAIKNEGTVGCPECWAQFGDEIRREFLRGSYGPKHIGKIPEKMPDGKPSRAFLEKALKDAIARQHYRKAARLRRALDELDGDKKNGDN